MSAFLLSLLLFSLSSLSFFYPFKRGFGGLPRILTRGNVFPRDNVRVAPKSVLEGIGRETLIGIGERTDQIVAPNSYSSSYSHSGLEDRNHRWKQHSHAVIQLSSYVFSLK